MRHLPSLDPMKERVSGIRNKDIDIKYHNS